jgi:hypothetical protein
MQPLGPQSSNGGPHVADDSRSIHPANRGILISLPVCFALLQPGGIRVAGERTFSESLRFVAGHRRLRHFSLLVALIECEPVDPAWVARNGSGASLAMHGARGGEGCTMSAASHIYWTDRLGKRRAAGLAVGRNVRTTCLIRANPVVTKVRPAAGAGGEWHRRQARSSRDPPTRRRRIRADAVIESAHRSSPCRQRPMLVSARAWR